jgi:hypothetical protein
VFVGAGVDDYVAADAEAEALAGGEVVAGDFADFHQRAVREAYGDHLVVAVVLVRDDFDGLAAFRREREVFGADHHFDRA